MTQGDQTRAHCNRCGASTNHVCLFSERSQGVEVVDEESGSTIDWWNTYEMLKCGGCDNVTMRHSSYFSEGNDDPVVVQYPPVIARRAPSWLGGIDSLFTSVPVQVEELLQEVYIAVQNGSRRLAAMGIRAALEHVMIEKVGDHGSFSVNIAKFQQDGHIAANEAEHLAAILDAGHATIHRGWKPEACDISTLLDITEGIINTVYIHPDQVEALRKNVPARPVRGALPEAKD